MATYIWVIFAFQRTCHAARAALVDLTTNPGAWQLVLSIRAGAARMESSETPGIAETKLDSNTGPVGCSCATAGIRGS